MLTVSLVVCAIVALATADDPAANHTVANKATCPANWKEHNHRCYYFEASTKNWADAEKQCQTMGGNLVSVHSGDEHKFIQTLTQSDAWIGGSGCQVAGAWFWIDGTAMSETFWCPQKPDNTLPECCLQTNSQVGKCWDDIACNTLLPYVCAKSM